MPLSEYIQHVAATIKRDDIRGVYGVDITPAYARALGLAMAEFSRSTTAVRPVNVVVGHDMRVSGPELAKAVCDGLEAGGCRPIELGLAGTELVGFLPAKYSDVIDGGVMVTASHNPKDNNGFKLFARRGQPLGIGVALDPPCPDDQFQRLGLGIKKELVPGCLPWEDFAPDYIQTVLEKAGCDFKSALSGAASPLRVAVEAGNGMGGKILREFAAITRQIEWTFSNDEPDGTFPVIVPNPLQAQYQQMVSDLVIRSGSHVGICFDGDADRVAVFDEKGRMVSPPLMAALVGRKLRERMGQQEKIAYNLACSWVIADTLGNREDVTGEGKAVITPVGYGKIKAIMHRDPRIAFGAEHSGHYMFREFWNADSGMMAGLITLELVAELHAQDKTFSSELEPLRARYFESGEINFELPSELSGESIIREAFERFKEEARRVYVVTEEGCRLADSYPPAGVMLAVADVRVECDRWWFTMRKSGTEGGAGGLLRLYLEAAGDRKLMEEKRDALIQLIGPELRI